MKRGMMMCAAAMLLAGPAVAQQTPQKPGQQPPAQTQQQLREAPQDVMKQIRQVGTDFEKAWNQQQFDQMANLYSENALLVNAEGQRLQGRKQIRQNLQQEITQGPMRNTRTRVEVNNAQLIGNDLAIAEFRQTSTPAGVGGGGGAGQPPPSRQPPQQQPGMQSQMPMTMEGVAILQRSGNRWQLLTTHVFPSRESMRQQMGVGGSGMQPPPPERKAPQR